jgi:hypothetical protein
LLQRGDIRNALANQLSEVALFQIDVLVRLQPVLEVQFEDGPQGLDAVEFGGVGGRNSSSMLSCSATSRTSAVPCEGWLSTTNTMRSRLVNG